MTSRVALMVTALAAAAGVSKGELADVIGIHRNRFTDKLAGRSQFREVEIIRLADYFGVAPGRLFEDPRELLGVGPVPERAQGLLTSTFGQLRRSEHIFGLTEPVGKLTGEALRAA